MALADSRKLTYLAPKVIVVATELYIKTGAIPRST